jgi:hypothetical protein
MTAVSLLLFWPAAFALGGNQTVETEYARLKGEYDAVQQAAILKNCNLLIETANEENYLASQTLTTKSSARVDSVTGEYLDNYNRSIKLKQSSTRISGYTQYMWNDADISGIRDKNKLTIKLYSNGTRGKGELTIIGDGTRLKGTIDMPNYAGRGGVWILSKLGPDGEVLKPSTGAKPMIGNVNANSQRALTEDDYLEYFGEAENEIITNTYDKNLWAKALVLAEGDEQKRKAIYIKLRAKQLYEEKN